MSKNIAAVDISTSGATNALGTTSNLFYNETGVNFLKNPLKYQISSIPIPDRKALGIQGMVPAAQISLKQNVKRSMENFRSKSTNLEKYIYLQSIQDVDENLYNAILVAHTTEVMPIVYTPTVGEACQKFSQIYRGTFRGLYLSLEDLGNVKAILENWPNKEKITTIVVTDGERILGLGDLGVNGMGIPIGKLALYTACGGIPPENVLPVHLDTGTNNKFNLEDPYYLGLKQKRERGLDYDSLVEEFFTASQETFGRNVLIQFEDFGNLNAFRLLERYKDRACTFNDDIQGTASVALAGLIASNRITGKSLTDHTYLFLGAGEAGVGIADLLAYAISVETGISIEEARKKIFLIDSKGLVTKHRLSHLQAHKIHYAHEFGDGTLYDLNESIKLLKPSVLIGVSANPNSFTKEILENMARINERPIICALSNPTSKAECTAQEAYEHTDGKAIFCSGSPFDPVTLNGKTHVPGQGNNAYIFPAIGLGALAAKSTKITDHDMYVAAHALAVQVSQEQLDSGCVYPPLSEIREVSAKIAAEVAANACKYLPVTTNYSH